ncbi:hypothetical protein J8F10_31170 [Gemmata sp. G18]|uniref:Uncharacterized protein n=1 Tax=Gemmata palustris TaxID=2822762 RepID=A0ABS5C1H9_9BACT|nr:hypothetical protein [Gemmata palustris]MBP3959730.1 hypothetical protein [Gemmata palustris]
MAWKIGWNARTWAGRSSFLISSGRLANVVPTTSVCLPLAAALMADEWAVVRGQARLRVLVVEPHENQRRLFVRGGHFGFRVLEEQFREAVFQFLLSNALVKVRTNPALSLSCGCFTLGKNNTTVFRSVIFMPDTLVAASSSAERGLVRAAETLGRFVGPDFGGVRVQEECRVVRNVP